MIKFIFGVCIYFQVVFFQDFRYYGFIELRIIICVDNLNFLIFCSLFVVLVVFISLIFGDMGIYMVDFYRQFSYFGCDIFLFFQQFKLGFFTINQGFFSYFYRVLVIMNQCRGNVLGFFDNVQAQLKAFEFSKLVDLWFLQQLL